MHDASIVVRCRKHRNVCRKLFEIEPGLLLDVIPIHFDEIVTFTVNVSTRKVGAGDRKRGKVNLFVTKITEKKKEKRKIKVFLAFPSFYEG